MSVADGTPKPLRVCAYARVSTADQHCENQLRDLRAHAQQRGWTIVEEYVDQGWSGAKESRPSLDRLMHDAWAGKFQAVLVWRFDRFARSTAHLVKALGIFRSLGISFTSLQEQIDTGSALGEAIFTIIAALSQLERQNIIERIHAGLRRAKAAGKVLGPKMANLDMTKVESLIAGGSSIRAAAREIGASPETVRRRLSTANRAMAGNGTASTGARAKTHASV